MGYFSKKKIWITGASSGIGKSLALAFAAQGATLILSSRKRDMLEEVKSACSEATQVDILPLDLQNHDELNTIFLENEALLSEVDILINNGGISQRSEVIETDFEVYKKIMDVNFFGTILLSRLILPHFLKKDKGHFVVMSSMAGKFGVPYRSGYSASKMALHGFFDALRAELKDSKVKVTLVCPGFVKTDISKNAIVGDGKQYGIMDQKQEKGMDVNVLAQKILSAIQNQKAEVYFGGFKEAKLAIFVSRIFPGIFRKIIANTNVK